MVSPDAPAKPLDAESEKILSIAVEKIKSARKKRKTVALAFGAHTIKNGLAPILIKLIESGWITHLATNGAGIIHDWEFAYQGLTSEDVRFGVERGEFGMWFETGLYINLALNIGAYEGKGYGESVGALISQDGVVIPDAEALKNEIIEFSGSAPERAGAAALILDIILRNGLSPGKMQIEHLYKEYSIQNAAYNLKVPFTGHPMFGHDIIYLHPANCGALLGMAAERDFLSFAHSIENIDDGVYISVGSAVMSPMIFEKSLSMCQNLTMQSHKKIENHFILVVDIHKSEWDWDKGEPPHDSPDYYMRFNKTFHRMGGEMKYLRMDNRDFFLHLYQELKNT